MAAFSVITMLFRFSVNSLLNAVMYIYCFAIINSLWKKIKEEETTGQRPTENGEFYAVVEQPKV